MFIEIGKKYNKPHFKDFMIVASNEIHEDVLYELNRKGNEVDAYGIGTNLITCLKQPALGMVYKLVSISGIPRLKLSEDPEKITLPGTKSLYRVYLKDHDKPAFDLIALREEPAPKEGISLDVVDRVKPQEKIAFTPVKVELLNPILFDGRMLGKPKKIMELQKDVYTQLDNIDPEILDHEKAKKYPVYCSPKLYNLVETLLAEIKK
ncbi:MAG: hypothetical protein P4L10_17065 [Acidobacteriaceae bacterium]|nr:hypothetical protein [Acidobacteriaceae bacterium]